MGEPTASSCPFAGLRINFSEAGNYSSPVGITSTNTIQRRCAPANEMLIWHQWRVALKQLRVGWLIKKREVIKILLVHNKCITLRHIGVTH
jgi:hypothetical protein